MKFPRNTIICFLAMLASAVLLLSAIGATDANSEVTYQSQGYVYNSEGKETNIKWTINTEYEMNVCRFEIDKTATDKVQTTVVTACTAEGKGIGWSNNTLVPWYYGGNVNKMVFGEGITAADKGVYMVISKIKTIEVSKDFKKTGYATFEANAGLNCFVVTGNEAVAGLADFTHMAELGSYCFDGAKFTDVIFGENIKNIPTECFKANKFAEINFPTTLESISDSAFINTATLKKITVNNPNMKISKTAFNNCVQLFTIVGYKGSTAETYAEEGGYEFVDITTGEVIIKGTRVVEKDPNEIMAQYPKDKADASGLLEHEYEGKIIVNTYWAYFKDSKTLVFISNGTGYNETGNQTSGSKDAQKYSEFKFEAEHIIVGPGIHKISNKAFEGFTALKTLQYSGNLEQIDAYAMHNCKSLSAIYKLGKNGEEGVADLAFLGTYAAGIIKNTSVETVKVNPKITYDKLNPIAFLGCKNIVGAVNDDTKTFAAENYYNLINVEDPEEIYENYMYINPDAVACGASSFASFDEETGTLTILGSGALNDIVNYYGGGSKKQAWFSYRKNIKKLIVGPKITYIGKYTFCQCVNLQEVELPTTPVEIGAGAFEKCYNLRSIYVTGNEPVIGTYDLRTVPTLEAWTFAYNYLLVNPIISETAGEIGSSTFEDCMNIEAVYGAPGSSAEAYALEKGTGFKDISAEAPVAKLATPPEMNQDEKERAERNEGGKDEETEPVETELSKYCIIIHNPPEGYVNESVESGEGNMSTAPAENDGGSAVLIIACISAAVIAVLAVVIVFVLKGRKEKK